MIKTVPPEKRFVARFLITEVYPVTKECIRGWKKQNGLFYAKGGKGIEPKGPVINKRKPSGYGANCPRGVKIYREKSKSEINELYKSTAR